MSDTSIELLWQEIRALRADVQSSNASISALRADLALVVSRLDSGRVDNKKKSLDWQHMPKNLHYKLRN